MQQSLVDKYIKEERGPRYGTMTLSAYARGACVAQRVVSIRDLPEEKSKLLDWLSINFNNPER